MNKNVKSDPQLLGTVSDLKIVRSFRLSPETVELVLRASQESGASQGDIIEQCVLEALESVSARLTRERQEKEASRLAALARVLKRPVGRPRKATGLKLHQQQ